jgi:hypothetical protein
VQPEKGSRPAVAHVAGWWQGFLFTCPSQAQPRSGPSASSPIRIAGPIGNLEFLRLVGWRGWFDRVSRQLGRPVVTPIGAKVGEASRDLVVPKGFADPSLFAFMCLRSAAILSER